MLINNCGPNITPGQIGDLETRIGKLLPDEYREFLLKYNGGMPDQDVNVVDIPNLPGSPTDVHVFLGIDRGFDSSNIEWNIETINTYHPACGFIPIAYDTVGGLFCLRGNNNYDVIYCDLGAPSCPCYPVASSFRSFLGRLRGFN